jgi:hypothetical protein
VQVSRVLEKRRERKKREEKRREGRVKKETGG